MTQAIIPELQPVADALLTANNKLAAQQQQYAGLQASDADLAAKYNLDEQAIAQLKATLAAAIIPPVFGGQIPNILVSIERLPGWKSDTDHDVKVFPHGPVTMTPQPDGWTDVFFKPAGVLGQWPSDNLYPHWDGIGQQPQATKFTLFGTFMLPTQADYAACQGLECQIEQCINGTTFDTCAWQLPLGGGHPFSKVFRYFDKVKKWQDSPVPFDPAIMQPGKAVSLVAESTVDHAGGIVHMTALTINGERHEFDLPVQPGKNQWPGANYVQFSAFQIDAVKNQPLTVRQRDCMAMWL
jgi:hypothetical protein